MRWRFVNSVKYFCQLAYWNPLKMRIIGKFLFSDKIYAWQQIQSNDKCKYSRNTRKLLVEHKANPNLLIPHSNIAPIHYAAGMENTNFAETAMKLILKHNGKILYIFIEAKPYQL